MSEEESTWEITEYEENKHVAVKFGSDKMQGDVGWYLEPSNGGTRVKFQIRGQSKGLFGKLMMMVFMPMIRRSIRRNFNTLKSILESQR